MRQISSNRSTLQFIFLMICTAWVYTIPEIAYAQGTGTGAGGGALDATLGASICQLIDMMGGMVGKAIATIAVMFLGIGSFFGKVSWGLVVTTTLGISLIFGAKAVAEALGAVGADAVCTAGIPPPPVPGTLEFELAMGLCTVADIITGNTGKALSTLAVVFIGIACFFGKASWSMVITTTVGISAIFGAGTIAEAIAFAGGWGDDCLP